MRYHSRVKLYIGLCIIHVGLLGQTTADKRNDDLVHAEVRVSDALGKALGYPQPEVKDKGMCPPPAWRNYGRAFCGDPPPPPPAKPARKRTPRRK